MPEPPCCGTCRCWHPGEASTTRDGECRARAPAPVVVRALAGVELEVLYRPCWPRTRADCWCACWQPPPVRPPQPGEGEALRAEVARLKALAEGLARRVAAQSEMLSQRAEKGEG
jgi:hypothetical protein